MDEYYSSSASDSDSSREAKKREKLEKKAAKRKSSKVRERPATSSDGGDVDSDRKRKKENKKKKEKRKKKEKEKNTKQKAREVDSSDSEDSSAGVLRVAKQKRRSSTSTSRFDGDHKASRTGDSGAILSAGSGKAKDEKNKGNKKSSRPAPSSSSSSSSDGEHQLDARASSTMPKQRSSSSLTSKPLAAEIANGKRRNSLSSKDLADGKSSSRSSEGRQATVSASKSQKSTMANQTRKERPKKKPDSSSPSSSSDSSSSESDQSLDADDLKNLSSRFSSSTKLSKVGNASGPITTTALPDRGGNTPKRASSTSELTPIRSRGMEDTSMEDLNSSWSRITVIDPMSRTLPKISRPPLPALDGEPDWLFKPKEDKLRGFLGISELVEQKRAGESKVPLPATMTTINVSSESKEVAKSLKKNRDKETKTKTWGASDSKERLFKLLNHDPSWAEERALYHDDHARELIKENPELAKEKYMFGSTKDKVYPLSMLTALHASVSTLRVCYKAFPEAIQFNDQWIGTCLHFACAYRAPLTVVKYLVSKDDDQLEQKNQAGRLPMHLACMVRTPLEKIEFLYAEFKQALSIKDKDGMTPLHLVCNRTDPDVTVVSFLANKNSKACVLQNSKGCTPLHLAVQHQTPINVLQALLAANNEVFSIPDKSGNLPLHSALQVNAENSIVQFCVWNYSEGLNHYNDKNERPIDIAKRIRKRDTDLHEILEPY